LKFSSLNRLKANWSFRDTHHERVFLQAKASFEHVRASDGSRVLFRDLGQAALVS
jgi:hypothetical protein